MFLMISIEQLVRAASARHGITWSAGGALGVLYAVGCHAWTMSCFCYSGVAFNLLSPSEIFTAWAALHHYGAWLVVLPALIAAVALVIPPHAPQALSLPSKHGSEAAQRGPGAPVAGASPARSRQRVKASPGSQAGRRRASPAPKASPESKADAKALSSSSSPAVRRRGSPSSSKRTASRNIAK